MRGEFIRVWSETWRELWQPLADEETAPRDMFCELYRELETKFATRLSVEALADIIDDQQQSRDEFERIASTAFSGERGLIAFLEEAHEILFDLGGGLLSNRYFNLLELFVSKFSLRYDLRRPCVLCPTLPGIFTNLMTNLRKLANQDTHIASLMNDYEEAVRDLRHGQTDGRIRTCLGKQFMLLESFGASSLDGSGRTLAGICDDVGSWPHATIKDSLKKLYGFSSDYPGIRHAGNPQGKLRDVDMRDLIAMSILLAGFTPYLSRQLDSVAVYGGR